MIRTDTTKKTINHALQRTSGRGGWKWREAPYYGPHPQLGGRLTWGILLMGGGGKKGEDRGGRRQDKSTLSEDGGGEGGKEKKFKRNAI